MNGASTYQWTITVLGRVSGGAINAEDATDGLGFLTSSGLEDRATARPGLFMRFGLEDRATAFAFLRCDRCLRGASLTVLAGDGTAAGDEDGTDAITGLPSSVSCELSDCGADSSMLLLLS